MKTNLNILPFLLILALINSCIELEITAPSFPDIMIYFDVTEYVVGGIITYNLIGFCVASLIWGPLSDAYGRRRIMIIGNIVLTIGAIGCVMSTSMVSLLIFRFFQGFGAATAAAVVSAIIADVYNTKKASHLYGLMNAVFTTFMAVSPILGGFITNIVGWRGNYGIVATVCLLSLGVLIYFLPETNVQKTKINRYKIIKDYKTLLSSSLFLSAAIAPSFLYGAYISFVAISPFLYTQFFKLSILTYSFHQVIIVGFFALTSAFSGKITSFLGVNKTLYIAVLTSLLGSGLMCLSTKSFLITAEMTLFCVGFALIYPLVFSKSVEIFPLLKGTASSAIMNLRYLLCSGIVGLTNYAYSGTPLSFTLIIFITTFITGILTIYVMRRF